MIVHNHGPEEGEGLACPELRLPPNDLLMGRCVYMEFAEMYPSYVPPEKYYVEGGVMEEKTTQHVHTHGLYGEGHACPEIRLPDGTYMGACTPYGKRQAANHAAFQKALKTSMTDSDFLLAQAKEEKVFFDRIRNERWGVAQNEPTDYIAAAKSYVRYNIEGMETKLTEPYEVYVVWFAKTLQNWKAVVCTTLPDGMLYEVTHNGDKRETYVDAYQKQSNIVIPD